MHPLGWTRRRPLPSRGITPRVPQRLAACPSFAGALPLSNRHPLSRKPARNKSPQKLGRGLSERSLTYKFRVSGEELRVIRERATGYPSPAEFGRRTLLGLGSRPLGTIRRVTEAFIPIQDVIDLARTRGFQAEADAAIEALREILAAVTER
jgi:hypothetical protein